MPRGRPHASCLRQMESYLKDTGMAGLAFALGDGQTEAEGVPSKDGRGDALLRRMPPYLTWPPILTPSITSSITSITFPALFKTRSRVVPTVCHDNPIILSIIIIEAFCGVFI